MKSHNQKGYTLLELLVAISIAAIVGTLAWTVLQRGNKQAHLRMKESDALQSRVVTTRREMPLVLARDSVDVEGGIWRVRVGMWHGVR